MGVVRVMQVRHDEIVGMRPMRDRFVAATGIMLVTGFVPSAGVRFGAVLGIRNRYVDDVLVDVNLVHEVKMTIVEIVHMPFVVDRRMRAAVGMFMRVVVVSRVLHAQSIQPRSDGRNVRHDPKIRLDRAPR